MSGAIKPDFFVNVPSLSTVRETKGATKEEEMLYAMSVTAGWRIFEDIAERAMLELNNINKDAISQGLPLEEIGRNTVVISLAQETINKLLNRVRDAVEACESGE